MTFGVADDTDKSMQSANDCEVCLLSPALALPSSDADILAFVPAVQTQ